MPHIRDIKQETKHRFLNFFTLDVTDKTGREFPYFVASRAEKTADLKAVHHENIPNGVIIYSVYGEKKDRIVLIKQYRYPIDDYIYEFPAGLVEAGESYRDAGVRELLEETGLTLTPVDADPMYEKPFFTTVGMTDESCATVYGYAEGTPSTKGLEGSEELEIVLADREEAKRILKEEKVAIMCAYMLMHFIASSEEDPLYFLKQD